MLTTDAAAERLADGRLPAEATTVVSVGPAGETLDARAAIRAVTDRGHRLILSEGGPRIVGALLEARLVDELFLTVSPLLFGRNAAERRFGLVEGADLLPGGPLEGRLLGVRRNASHLFLRYSL